MTNGLGVSARRPTLLLLAFLLTLATPVQASPPGNDDFDGAQMISSLPYEDSVSAVEATNQPGEPNPYCGPSFHTVWYRYTADTSIRLVGNTDASSQAVIAGIYTGPSLGDLTNVSCGDPVERTYAIVQKFSFDVEAGTTYYIQLGSPNSAAAGEISLLLAREATIAGAVTRDDGRPLRSCIDVRDEGDRFVGGTQTPDTGQYLIHDLPGGAYRMYFTDCADGSYAPEWYDDKPSLSMADTLNVPSGGALVGIDATLSLGGMISGIVVDDATGAPVAGQNVVAFLALGGRGPSDAQTDAEGKYVVRGLQDGPHKLYFPTTYSTSGTHFSEWYRDKPDAASADPVDVSIGNETSNVNASLAPVAGTGSISGRVTSAGGDPVLRACITAYVAEIPVFPEVLSDVDGNYRIDGVGEGSFKLQFRDCSDVRFIPEWYRDKPGYESADPVVVHEGQATSGVDAVVEVLPQGSISGRVTSESTGQPIPGICVTLFEDQYTARTIATTNLDGEYHGRGIVPGTYHIQFFDCAGQVFQSEWYNDKPDFASADPLTVVDGVNTSDIDASLYAPPPPEPGAISGVVRAESTTEPLTDTCVGVYQLHELIDSTRTATDGRYTVTGLAEGYYRVEFSDCGRGEYYDEWFDNQWDYDSATPVWVAFGATTTGIDGSLERLTYPDLAVTSLSIYELADDLTPSGLPYDPFPPIDPNWQRGVILELTNTHMRPAYGVALKLESCPETAGPCQTIFNGPLGGVGSGRASFTYYWNGFGTVGDVTVTATVDYTLDPDKTNDQLSTDYFVTVEGHGAGVRVPPP